MGRRIWPLGWLNELAGHAYCAAKDPTKGPRKASRLVDCSITPGRFARRALDKVFLDYPEYGKHVLVVSLTGNRGIRRRNE